MINRTEWKLEELDQNSWRVKVMGGWIVYHQIMGSKYPITMTGTFCPDPYHAWQIIDPKLTGMTPSKPKIPECLL